MSPENHTPSKSELEQMPVPSETVATMREQESSYRDRLLDSRSSYWNTLATLHSVILSAASIVATVKTDSPKWPYLIVAGFCFVGIVSVALGFKLMTGFYDRMLIQPGTFTNMATFHAFRQKLIKEQEKAQIQNRDRKSYQRAAEFAILGAVLGLIILVIY